MKEICSLALVFSLLSIILLTSCKNEFKINDFKLNVSNLSKNTSISQTKNSTNLCPPCPTQQECEDCEECEKCKKCTPCPKQTATKCPTCVTCEECEECKNCDDYASLSSSISIQELKLYKTSDAKTFIVYFNFSLLKNNLSFKTNITKIQLLFKPDCDENETKINSYLNNLLISSKAPECSKDNILELTISKLNEENNSLKLEFLAKEEYYLKNIELEITFKNGTKELIGFDNVKIEQAQDYEKTHFKDLDDSDFRNYIEFSFDLTKTDIKNDFLFSFDGSEREGKLKIEINDYVLYNDEIERKENEIIIPKARLKTGTNNLRIVMLPKE
jgi:hypothetical protein